MTYQHEVTCPACENTQEADVAFIGAFGNLLHYRCRYCGIQFSENVNEKRSEDLHIQREN